MEKTEELKYSPKYIPFRCPKCAGRGRVNWDKEVCNACNGTGILKVPPEEEDGEK